MIDKFGEQAAKFYVIIVGLRNTLGQSVLIQII
jgi:hypothetical protein